IHFAGRAQLLPRFVRLRLRFLDLALRFALSPVRRAPRSPFLILLGGIANQMRLLRRPWHDRSRYWPLPAVRKRNHVKRHFVLMERPEISVRIRHGAFHPRNRSDALHM